MEKFKKASAEGRIESVVKHYSKYRILIIDEIGYLPIDKDVANGFFQLVAARYEKRPIHHSYIIKITGQSYRIKGKLLYDEEGDVGSR